MRYDPNGTGAMFFAVLAAAGQIERNYIRENTHDGQARPCRASPCRRAASGGPVLLAVCVVAAPLTWAVGEQAECTPKSREYWKARPRDFAAGNGRPGSHRR
ncbi:hypothetical protein [Streptomyces sp. NPDC017993]|uniref:hypothetical protein n=1 Tax=Streptomyces sp. NPDC017993 TaxID=3365027 RepID=UPI0037A1C79A